MSPSEREEQRYPGRMDEAARSFFHGRPEAAKLYAHVDRLLRSIGDFECRVTKSQIAFRRRRGFAWVWTPDRWLQDDTAPLVLSVALGRRDASQRWKEVVEPQAGRWMHHLEVRSASDLDDEVASWLREAWAQAG